jgi:hypothetical protein
VAAVATVLLAAALSARGHWPCAWVPARYECDHCQAWRVVHEAVDATREWFDGWAESPEERAQREQRERELDAAAAREAADMRAWIAYPHLDGRRGHGR